MGDVGKSKTQIRVKIGQAGNIAAQNRPAENLS